MFRKLLLVAAVAVVPAGLLAAASIAVASAPGGAAPARCAGVIQITRLAFSPPVSGPGSSTATLVARNCTRKSQQVTVTWFGMFSGSGTGIPAGCPAVDPFPQQESFAPRGTVTASVGYTVPLCAATQFNVTVQIAQNGTILAAKTASLTIVEPTASLSAAPSP